MLAFCVRTADPCSSLGLSDGIWKHDNVFWYALSDGRTSRRMLHRLRIQQRTMLAQIANSLLSGDVMQVAESVSGARRDWHVVVFMYLISCSIDPTNYSE